MSVVTDTALFLTAKGDFAIEIGHRFHYLRSETSVKGGLTWRF